MFRSVFRAAVCFAALSCSVSLVHLAAQTSFGRISGTVTDPSGASVPGAKVTVLNTDTQAVRTVSTDDRGFYVAESLPIGPYNVAVDQAGFRRVEHHGLLLVADGRMSSDFALQIGEIAETVEVMIDRSEALNTVSGEISHVIDSRQVDNLGLNGRNYMELLTLIPGAIMTSPDLFGVMTSLSATNQIVNGHRNNQNNMTVDGLGNLDGGSNGSLINNISPDFMQEVKIQTSNFSAEYGRSAGVAFNLLTKNGTNGFHGAAFEYFRNNALDARNFFSASTSELRFNDFGWDLGGPIKKNKIFFFAGQEWKRLRQQAQPSRQTLPDLLQLQGDFSELLTPTKPTIVYQPGTKTPFPNNLIPVSMITADGKAIGNVYKTVIPMASIFTNQAVANNATFESPSPLDYREDIARVDYKINDNHTMYGRFVDDSNSIYVPNGPGGNIPITPEVRDRPAKSMLLSEIWVTSPTLINEARAGASMSSQHYWNQGNTWLRSMQGFTFPRVYNSVGPYAGGIPDGSITSFASWRGPAGTLIAPTTQIEAADTVTIIRGQHSIRTGFSIIRNRKDQNGRSAYDGNVTFNATSNPNTTGYALADALLGNFNTYTEAAYDPMGHYRYTQPSLFVDDAWKVSRRLSINLGLRYEYMMAMYSTVDNLSEFVPALYNPAKAVTVNASGQVVTGSGNISNGLQRVANGINPAEAYLVPNANDPAVLAVPAGAPRGMYPSKGKFEPRVGFAYSLSPKTVVRGGFGIFYDRIQGNPTFYTLNNPPYVASASYLYANLSNVTGGSTVNAPWGTIQTIDPNLVTPYSEQFSFTVQQQLPLKVFGEAGYVGTLGRHLLVEPDINQPGWAALSTAAPTANENSLRPYAGYSIIQQFMSAATSNYHALQTNITRRAGSVLFTGAYTWSKNLSDASADTSNDLNAFNLKTMYGPAGGSSMDVRHAFVGTFVWDLPALRSQKSFIRVPVAGWQLSGILHLQTGFYYTVTANTNILGGRVADYVGGPVLLPNPGPNGWFNSAAFAAAPQNRWGTSGAGNVQGPGMQVYNLSLTKSFDIRENLKLRVRADFVNAFNNVNFNGFASMSLSSASFGTISAAFPARNIQLSGKLQF